MGVKVLGQLFLTRWLSKRSQICKIQDSIERTYHSDVETTKHLWNGLHSHTSSLKYSTVRLGCNKCHTYIPRTHNISIAYSDYFIQVHAGCVNWSDLLLVLLHVH